MSFLKNISVSLLYVLLTNHACAETATLTTTTFSSELSGIINRKLSAMGASASSISATLSGYSRAAASFASNYAASAGISASAMSWSTLAYGLGVTTVSLGIYAAGKPFAEEVAKLVLDKNGYNAFYYTPAMSAGVKAWHGGFDNCYVTSTSPFSAAARVIQCLPPEEKSSLQSSYYTPPKSDVDNEWYRFYYAYYFRGSWSQSSFVFWSVTLSEDSVFCDNGQVLFYSDGNSTCEAATTENPFSSSLHVPSFSGNNLASQDIADILNGLTEQLDGLSEYSGISSFLLKYSSADVDNYRSTVDLRIGDSASFTESGVIAIP
ncbi:TPA: hypothetical protein N7D18_005097, partial [Escherichia coli]|nr:hypothetical protein [Escherichia coli]